MQSLSNELRGVIETRLRAASPQQVLKIASALCNTEVENAQPASKLTSKQRFEVRGDIVVDHRTGLMWSRGNVPGGRMNWAKAKEAAEGLLLGTHTDWRLPTIRELLTIVDYERHDPAIDTNVFQCESSWYWTSTPAASSPGDYAWCVFFGSGYAYWYYHDSSGFVRACRAGQSVEDWF